MSPLCPYCASTIDTDFLMQVQLVDGTFPCPVCGCWINRDGLTKDETKPCLQVVSSAPEPEPEPAEKAEEAPKPPPVSVTASRPRAAKKVVKPVRRPYRRPAPVKVKKSKKRVISAKPKPKRRVR